MPGLFGSLTAASALLLARADSTATITALPFSPLKLVLLLGWIYLCLYLVQHVDDHPLTPDRYKPILRLVTLFVGPLVLLGLMWADKQESGKKWGSLAEVIEHAKEMILGIWRARWSRETPSDSNLQLFDSSGAELSEIYGHGARKGDDKRVLNLTAQIIDDALRQRASDILIDPKDQASYAVRLRIDGALRVVRELPTETCKAVINSVKAVSSMDISERRRPQDGAFTARRNDMTVSFRVASAGALNGEKLSIRALNQNAGKFTLTDVGIPRRQYAVIAEAIKKPAGMVLICGPTGSGKTTTLYSMLNQIDRMTHNVITVEDPIEAHLPGVSQLEINAKADITFAKALRSILRQDPDVICVGEIRDEETAEIALCAAQTGHLVLATIHCDSNATALIRLLDLNVTPTLLSSGLSLLLSQRLVRKLCNQCKKPAQVGEKMAQELHQKGIDTKNIFAAGGCEVCGGTGYYGRMAICDLLLVTDELRKAIANDPAISAKLRSEAEKKGRSNLRSEALRAVIGGITSFDELKRVVG